jgi:hypothetical protein
MLAKILIPVTGTPSEATKSGDATTRGTDRPSFLLIPAVPSLDGSARGVK